MEVVQECLEFEEDLRELERRSVEMLTADITKITSVHRRAEYDYVARLIAESHLIRKHYELFVEQTFRVDPGTLIFPHGLFLDEVDLLDSGEEFVFECFKVHERLDLECAQMVTISMRRVPSREFRSRSTAKKQRSRTPE